MGVPKELFEIYEIARKSQRDLAISRVTSEGLSGIVNVVSYGYHEYDRGRDEVPGPVDSDGKADPGYLEYHRQTEIEGLDEWVPRPFLGRASQVL